MLFALVQEEGLGATFQAARLPQRDMDSATSPPLAGLQRQRGQSPRSLRRPV